MRQPAKSRTDYGPVQFGDAVGLSRGEFERATDAGLIPAPDVAGSRWSAAVVADVAARMEAVRAALPPPPLGANKCAARLAEATGLGVDRVDVEELAERGLLAVADYYKDWPLYDVADLDALAAGEAGAAALAEIVAERQGWLAASIDRYRAAERLGVRRDEFERIAAERGVSAGRFGRFSLDAVLRLAADEDLAEQIRLDRLLGPGQAAQHLEIRRTDLEYVLAAGWLAPVRYAHSRVGRRKTVAVPLFRVGDVEAVREIPGVDWEAVHAVRAGEPSPLREYARLPAARAQVIRAFCGELGDRHGVEVWAHWVNAADVWEIDWDRTEDGHPTRDEVAAALGAHPGAARYRDQVELDTPVGETIRWARSMLRPGAAVVLDTETTDLDGVVIEVAVVDAASGVVLLDTLVHPDGETIHPDARRVHGITDAELAGAPSWAEVYPRLLDAAVGRTVLAYNADFDAACLQRTTRRHGLDHAPLAALPWDCLMAARSAWWRTWRWLALGGGHRARGDALDALEILRALAAPPPAG